MSNPIEFGVSPTHGFSFSLGSSVGQSASGVEDVLVNGETVVGEDKIARVSIPTHTNENLLINPWFEVNQRQVTNFTVGKYGVDRWKLVSGSASVVNGGIQLNGTLRQILEYSVENTVFASVKMTSGTATATYNDTTKYFDIVSSGGVIRAAKLEIGTVSTLQNDVKPNLYEQLQICKRFYEEIFYDQRPYICEQQYIYVPQGTSQTKVVMPLRFFPKRSLPNITIYDYENVAISYRPVTSGSRNYLRALSVGYGAIDYRNGVMEFDVQSSSSALPVGASLVAIECMTAYSTHFMVLDSEIN